VAVRKPGSTLFAITLIAIALSLWLALHGLMIRLTGTYLPLQAAWLFIFYDPASPGAAGLIGVDPDMLAWPLIAFGLAWVGVLVGIWIRARWARRAGILLALICLLAPTLASLLSILLLAAMFSAPIRRWLEESPHSDEERLGPDPLH
jgi:hypothetical protein